MTDVADILDRAGDLLEPEGAWTQGWSARTASGDITFALAPDAVCWCMGGAIVRAAGDDDVSAAYRLMGMTVQGAVKFNDAPGRTQSEVVAAFRKAAQLARAQGLSS